MKEFIYDKAIDEDQAKIITRRLIYKFFKGNIRTKKVMIEGKLQDETVVSFKRPFGFSDGELSSPAEVHELFPEEELYVLVHYEYKNNSLPLFLAPSSQIQLDLEDVDELEFYEYSYIFDKNFSCCFFVTDAVVSKDEKYVAVLLKFDPL